MPLGIQLMKPDHIDPNLGKTARQLFCIVILWESTPSIEIRSPKSGLNPIFKHKVPTAGFQKTMFSGGLFTFKNK